MRIASGSPVDSALGHPYCEGDNPMPPCGAPSSAVVCERCQHDPLLEVVRYDCADIARNELLLGRTCQKMTSATSKL
eukprot:3902341-Amphidinium_carterae.1